MSTMPESMREQSSEFQAMLERYLAVQCRYQAAIRQVRTKLENLDEEFRTRHRRTPIHSMQARLKTLPSIMDKLNRRDLPVNMNSAESSLTDIAGVRVICSYIDDIYALADLLIGQDDVTLLRIRDYIKTPKANGYRSLHLIVQVPVYLAEGKLLVPVEIQIRTIAMDFWASLEHQLRYKAASNVPASIADKLAAAAADIDGLDRRMRQIRDEMDALAEGENPPS